MKTPEFYETDVLTFFNGRSDALTLYQAFHQQMNAAFPEASVKVQKSQISYYGRHLFAMVSLPRRKREPGIVVSLGLDLRLDSPRIAAASEPYPGRWTHHIPVTCEEDLDRELLSWLVRAWNFAERK